MPKWVIIVYTPIYHLILGLSSHQNMKMVTYGLIFGANGLVLEISQNPKKTYLAPERLNKVPDFNFKPLDDAFSRLTSSAWRYEEALLKYKKGSLSAEKKSEINAFLRKVDQAFISEKGLPRRKWFRNMLYAPGYYTGYGVKTLPGIREGLEERNWNEVNLYINEVARALDRASNNINSVIRILNEN